MYSVVHFELPFRDRDRAVDFYAKAFGWKATKFGPEMGNYATVETGETDPQTQLPLQPGAINGGLFEKTKENQFPSVVLAVDDIRQAMKEVEEAGGRVIGGTTPGEPDDIPGVGLYCAISDTEGNRIGMLQPAPMPA